MQVKTLYIISTKDMKSQSLIKDKEGIELYTCGLFETKEVSSATTKAFSEKVVSVVTRRYIFVDKLEILEE